MALGNVEGAMVHAMADDRKKGSKGTEKWDTWLAQLVEHATLDLRVVSLSPVLGIELTKKENKKTIKTNHRKVSMVQYIF